MTSINPENTLLTVGDARKLGPTYDEVNVATGTFSNVSVSGAITGAAVTGYVTLTGIQTLTNKTLTTPTINSPVISGASMTTGGNITMDNGSSLTFGNDAKNKIVLTSGGTTATSALIGTQTNEVYFNAPTATVYRFKHNDSATASMAVSNTGVTINGGTEIQTVSYASVTLSYSRYPAASTIKFTQINGLVMWSIDADYISADTGVSSEAYLEFDCNYPASMRPSTERSWPCVVLDGATDYPAKIFFDTAYGSKVRIYRDDGNSFSSGLPQGVYAVGGHYHL